MLAGLETRVPLGVDPPVVLRPAEEADAAALRLLYLARRAPEFASLGMPGAILAPLLEGQFRARQAGYAAQFPGLATYVPVSAGEIAGHIMLAREPDGTCAIRIVDIALAAEWQGRGLGGAMLTRVEAAVRAAAFEALNLEVAVTNPGARRLYERLGFNEISGRPGAGVISAAMRKDLR